MKIFALGNRNWFQLVPFALGIIALLSVILLTLSPFTTSTLNFYKNWIWVPFVLLIAVFTLPFFDFIPAGQYDPETFPLQKFLGYSNAALVSLVLGVAYFFLFGLTVTLRAQTYLPVPQLFVTAVDGGGFSAFSLLSGSNPIARAFFESFLVSWVEDFLILLPSMGLVWVVMRFLLTIFAKIPPRISNYLGMALGVMFAAHIVFPNLHVIAYQGVEPAYQRATLFAYLTLIPAALTGFPLTVNLAHLGNNMFASVGGFTIARPLGGLFFGLVQNWRRK